MKREISISNKSFEVEYYSNYTDGKLSLYNIIRDVTRDKEREKELILKSVALKEIHHRVKNNLQTIASLLKMQKRRIENEECKKILEDSINRLVSMAITHEIMSQNGFDDLEIGDIIRLIYKNSFRSGIDKNKKILFTLFKEQLYIDSDKASSIALVVNEILQNISDHAFKGTDNCEVKIDLKEGPVFSSLIISDNGVGMDVEKVEKGLGMTIIKAIVEEKLKGKLKIVSIPQIGTTIEFDFKKTN